MLNKYFNNQPNRRSNEQNLYEDLINESIQIRGHDIYYILRESRDKIDFILGEDPTSKFEDIYKMEVYVQNVKTFDGDEDYISAFGLEIRDNIKFLLTGRTFERMIPSNIAVRPREGDLIYSTLLNKMFEITFVKNDPIFYSLGRRSIDRGYIYELSCETFKYSHEKIDTGIKEIDEILRQVGYIQELFLDTGIGEYIIGEEVYTGNTLETATSKGKVVDWNPINKVIKIGEITGEFSSNTILIGNSSLSKHTIIDYDKLENQSRENIIDNLLFEQESNNSIIKTEINPFGAP